MKKRRLNRVLFIILLLLIAAIGALILLRPNVVEDQRQEVEKALFHMIKVGQTQMEMDEFPDLDEVSASDLEDLGEYYPRSEDLEPFGDTEEKKVLTGYGLIEIPSISLEMPLVKGADAYSLWAAIGWWPQSAEMGTAGNCVVFGHRMVTYGQHFNRLGECKTGDRILLYNMEGESFSYTVTGSEVIEPEELIDTLYEHNTGFQLTLVTCTPTGVGSQRLLVYAELDAEPGKEATK